MTGNIPVGPASLVAFASGFAETGPGAFNGTGLEIFDQAKASRLGDAALVDALSDLSPEAVSFTLFSWNVERSLFVASELRSRLPGTFILFGGPEVARGSVLYDIATGRSPSCDGMSAAHPASSPFSVTAVEADLSLLPDDIAVRAAREVMKGGARSLYLTFVHPVMAGGALEKLRSLKPRDIIACNTIESEVARADVVPWIAEVL